MTRTAASALLLSIALSLPQFAEDCRRGFEGVDLAITADPIESYAFGDFNEDGRLDIVFGKGREELSIGLSVGNRVYRSHGVAVLPALGGIVNDAGVLQPFDTDHDGHLDLVARKYNTIYVARGRGDGTFGAFVQTIRPPSQSWAYVPATGEGTAAFFDFDTTTIRILTPTPTGAFEEVTPAFPHSWSNAEILPGDFDGDGLIDLAVGFQKGVYVLRNQGGLSFQKVFQRILPFYVANRLSVDDVDGDGRAEVIASGRSSAILIRPRNGTAPPDEEIEVDALLDQFHPAQSADLDGDGVRDLTFRSWNALAIVRRGPAALPQVVMLDIAPGSLAHIIDLDHDGVDDVTTITSEGIAVLYGRADDPPFSIGLHSPAGAGNRFASTADIDHDGRLDLISTGDNNVWWTKVAAGADDLRFREKVLLENHWTLAAADFDGDGEVDLAVHINVPGTPRKILFGDGSWSFTEAVQIPTTGTFVNTATVAGRTVLFFKNTNAVLQQIAVSSERQLVTTDIASTTIHTDVFIADLDGDQDSDLILNEGTSAPSRILEQTPDGWKERPATFREFESFVEVADMNGDGLPDLIAGTLTDVAILTQRLDGSYDRGREIYVGSYVRGLAVMDMDGDRTPDLVVATQGNSHEAGFIRTYRNAGDGTMMPHGTTLIGSAHSMTTADVDHDGWNDVIAATDVGVTVLRNACLPRTVRAAVTRPVLYAGEPLDLYAAVTPHPFDCRNLHVRRGAEILQLQMDEDPLGYCRFVLPTLPPGEHVLTVEYDDGFEEKTTADVRVRFQKTTRRRSVR